MGLVISQRDRRQWAYKEKDTCCVCLFNGTTCCCQQAQREIANCLCVLVGIKRRQTVDKQCCTLSALTNKSGRTSISLLWANKADREKVSAISVQLAIPIETLNPTLCRRGQLHFDMTLRQTHLGEKIALVDLPEWRTSPWRNEPSGESGQSQCSSEELSAGCGRIDERARAAQCQHRCVCRRKTPHLKPVPQCACSQWLHCHCSGRYLLKCCPERAFVPAVGGRSHSRRNDSGTDPHQWGSDHRSSG